MTVSTSRIPIPRSTPRPLPRPKPASAPMARKTVNGGDNARKEEKIAELLDFIKPQKRGYESNVAEDEVLSDKEALLAVASQGLGPFTYPSYNNDRELPQRRATSEKTYLPLLNDCARAAASALALPSRPEWLDRVWPTHLPIHHSKKPKMKMSATVKQFASLTPSSTSSSNYSSSDSVISSCSPSTFLSTPTTSPEPGDCKTDDDDLDVTDDDQRDWRPVDWPMNEEMTPVHVLIQVYEQRVASAIHVPRYGLMSRREAKKLHRDGDV